MGAEVTHVPNGPETVEIIQNNFRETFKVGRKYDQALTSQCRNIITRHQTYARNNSMERNKLYLASRNMRIESSRLNAKIQRRLADQKENQEKLENVRDEIKENMGKLQDQTTDFVQRQRVLKRLMYLINDELKGNQRESTVGNFEVDKSLSGFSFLEVHNQLKGLNSGDALVNSMITTLIMITKDKKDVFANQEGVKKIRQMIFQIMKKDRIKMQRRRFRANMERRQLNNKVNSFVRNSERNMNIVAEARAGIASNERAQVFIQSQIKDLSKHASLLGKKIQSNMQYCGKLKRLINIHARTYSRFVAGLNHLKAQLK